MNITDEKELSSKELANALEAIKTLAAISILRSMIIGLATGLVAANIINMIDNGRSSIWPTLAAIILFLWSWRMNVSIDKIKKQYNWGDKK